MTKLFPVFLAVVLTVSYGLSSDVYADGGSDWTSVRQVSYSQVSANRPSTGAFVTQGAKGSRLRWGTGTVTRATVDSYDVDRARPVVVQTQFNEPVNNGRQSDLVAPIAQTNGGNIAPPRPLDQPQDWIDPSSGAVDTEIVEPQLPGQSEEEIQRGVQEIIEPQGEALFTTDPCDGRSAFKPICEISYSIAQEPGTAPGYCDLDGSDMLIPPRQWNDLCFTWKASGMCHKPLYFDDYKLERYGHSWGPLLQPIISTGRFWATIPILPYKMGVNPPDECIYTLGHYRPNSCTPYMIDPLPVSVRGALFEAGAWVGGAFLIP